MSNNRVLNPLIERLLKQYSAPLPVVTEDERNIDRFQLENDIAVHVLWDEKGYLHRLGFRPLPAQSLGLNDLPSFFNPILHSS
ncbi:MAG: hypothetical protein P8X74_15150 [Reinekea sp.]|jgi:hypothetical protein